MTVPEWAQMFLAVFAVCPVRTDVLSIALFCGFVKSVPEVRIEE